MTLRLLTLLTLAGAASAVFSAQALGQACQGRPGASAIEQYCEAIPDGAGERVTAKRERERRQAERNVSAATAQELGDAGRAGAAVLALTASGNAGDGGKGGGGGGSSSSGGGAGGSSGGGGKATEVAAATSPSDNPLKAVSSAVGDGATVGPAFLWGLLGLAVAAAAAAWVGFRRRGPTPES